MGALNGVLVFGFYSERKTSMILSPLYIMLLGPALLFALYAQFKVKHAFGKYSKIPAKARLTGAQAAYEMLRGEGISDITIERIGGFLSDHYDPRAKTLRLSPEVYDGYSVAALGVACHEAGHAIQDAKAYAPLAWRNTVVPMASIGSSIGIWLIILGIVIAQLRFGAYIGLALFSMVAIFQIINLPVEFNASNRAKLALGRLGMIHDKEEADGVASVLSAAAMTYVAATATAILQVVYWAMVLSGSRSER